MVTVHNNTSGNTWTAVYTADANDTDGAVITVSPLVIQRQRWFSCDEWKWECHNNATDPLSRYCSTIEQYVS